MVNTAGGEKYVTARTTSPRTSITVRLKRKAVRSSLSVLKKVGAISWAALKPIRAKNAAAEERPAATIPVTTMTPSQTGSTFLAAQMNAVSEGEMSGLKTLMVAPPSIRKM